MELLTVPQGEFTLDRYPVRKNDPLRAWDAADEYILQHVGQELALNADSSLLIVNDSFGAICVGLAEFQPYLLSDSWIAHQGTLANLKSNNQPAENVLLLNSLEATDYRPGIVIIKIPKTLAQLEEQLHHIRPMLSEDTVIIGAGMTRNIHNSTLALFEKIIGPTKTSLARKKSRLIFSQFDSKIEPGTSPYPEFYILDGTDYKITNHANVFSREKLDIGTRFLLQHLPATEGPGRVVDLGCGNGVLGLMAAHRNPEVEVVFADESYMAVASAKASFEAAFGADRQAEYHVTDCLKGIEDNSIDLILNNPPFHQQHAISDYTALQMFSESKQALNQGGQLWVVGNRHLEHDIKLKSLFGNCTVLASNKKFVILKAVKR